MKTAYFGARRSRVRAAVAPALLTAGTLLAAPSWGEPEAAPAEVVGAEVAGSEAEESPDDSDEIEPGLAGTPVVTPAVEPPAADDLGVFTDNPGVEVIEVRAQRRVQSIQKVPISVTAFSKKQIEENQIEELADYLNLTPNVAFSNNGNRGRTQIAIRGVSNLGGRANTFGVYVDGFNIAPSSSTREYDPNLVDAETIEVLRGPQGTFFGRNSTAGAINITSVKPGPEFEASLEGEYGNFNTGRGRGVVNVPILEDSLFMRVSGYYEHSDGFVENNGPAGGRSDLDAWGLRAATRFQPNEIFTNDLSVRYNDYEQGINSSVIREPTPVFPPEGGVPSSPWRVNLNFPGSTDIEGWILTNSAKLELDPVTLTSITGFITNEYREIADQDNGADEGGNWQRSMSDLTSVSQEIRLNATLFDSIDAVGGVFYAWDRLEIDSFRGNLDQAPFPGTPEIDRSQEEETRTWAVFGDAIWTVFPWLDLTLGGRYTGVEYERMDTERPSANNGQTFSRLRNDLSEHDFSFRTVATVRWSETFLTYAGYNTAFRNGGFNRQPPPEIPIRYDAEKLKAIEGGFKLTLWDERFRANAATFYYDWDDLQLFVADPADLTNAVFVANASDARLFGVEVELAAVPVKGLELTLNGGYLKSRFGDFEFLATTNLRGKPLPQAPEWTFSATGQYSHPLGWTEYFGEIAGFVRAEWSFVETRFRDATGIFFEDQISNDVFVLPQYDIANLRWGLQSERARLVFSIENLLEEEYFTGVRGLELVDPRPRRYGARLTLTF